MEHVCESDSRYIIVRGRGLVPFLDINISKPRSPSHFQYIQLQTCWIGEWLCREWREVWGAVSDGFRHCYASCYADSELEEPWPMALKADWRADGQTYSHFWWLSAWVVQGWSAKETFLRLWDLLICETLHYSWYIHSMPSTHLTIYVCHGYNNNNSHHSHHCCCTPALALLLCCSGTDKSGPLYMLIVYN